MDTRALLRPLIHTVVRLLLSALVLLVGQFSGPRQVFTGSPAVVLITGSGAQNRDEDVFGFKVFGVLADQLTRHGIAVYRHDDRGAVVRVYPEANHLFQRARIGQVTEYAALDKAFIPGLVDDVGRWVLGAGR